MWSSPSPPPVMIVSSVLTPSSPCSDVQGADVACVGLDEVASRLHLVAHQQGEDLVGRLGVLEVDLLEDAGLRAHRRLAQLLGIHLAEPLEAVDLDPLARQHEDLA